MFLRFALAGIAPLSTVHKNSTVAGISLGSAMTRGIALGICLIVAGINSAGAVPIPVLDLRQLVASADVIVSGRVTTLGDSGPVLVDRPSGPISERRIAAQVDVLQVLKGTAPGTPMSFSYIQADDLGYRAVPTGTVRLLFLKRLADGTMEVVSPYYPSIVASARRRPVTGDPLTDVLILVADVLQTSPLRAQKQEAIATLAEESSAVTTAALRGALKDSDQVVRVGAAAALLKENDEGALVVAAEALIDNAGTPPELKHNIAVGLRQMRSARPTPALRRIWSRGNAEARRAVVFALDANRGDTMDLLRASLEDADFQVRLAAVRKLAQAAGRLDLVPSDDAFRADEAHFIQSLRAVLPVR